MSIRLISVITTCLLLAACQSAPQVQTGEGAEIIGDNLHRVDNSRAAKSYINPDIDFSQYNRVMLPPLSVSHVEIIQPSGNNRRPGNPQWELTDEDRKMLQEAYDTAMTSGISEKGGYEIVTAPDRGVIAVMAKLLSLAPSAPKDDMNSRVVGSSRVFTEGAGSASIEIAFVDAQSGEVVAVAVDGKSSQSNWGVNNSVTNRADIQRMFNAWAAQVRRSLDEAHGQE